MGSGHGIGFSPRPNLAVYGLLVVWETPEAFAAFATERWHRRYAKNAREHTTVILRCRSAKGLWNGTNPFYEKLDARDETTPLTAVITRATIRPHRALRFWLNVPATGRAAGNAPGRIFSIGIGEVPWIQQATFSVWESLDAIQAFAYRGHVHRTAIARTHQYNWYSEELFARFMPVATIGDWGGHLSLETYGITRFEAVPSPAELRGVTSVEV